MEQLPSYSYHHHNEIRKSCSELPTSFQQMKSSNNQANPADFGTNTGKFTNSNCLVFESDLGVPMLPKDCLSRKPPLPSSFESMNTGQSSNYFCESDFDDSREQIPNYQMKLKLLQDEFYELIQQLDLLKNPEFEWPSEDMVDNKIQVNILVADLFNFGFHDYHI